MPSSGRIPSHTRRFLHLAERDVDGIRRIIASKAATEHRGQLPVWDTIAADRSGRVVWIESEGREDVLVRADDENDARIVDLYDSESLAELFASGPVLLDISGLPHHIWAPLLKAAIDRSITISVLYAEPDSYKEHPSPSSASYFDLSATFEGLAPLPGFANLSDPPDEEKCLFVALLGFEGNRPSSLIHQVDPTPRVIPVIGVPGFQIEYPNFTVSCNRDFLYEYDAFNEIRLARASCPFEIVRELRELHCDYPEHYLYIAPVGTKPHALGAILYALESPEMTEIMFDHPVRKPGRTAGIGVVHIFDIADFGN